MSSTYFSQCATVCNSPLHGLCEARLDHTLLCLLNYQLNTFDHDVVVHNGSVIFLLEKQRSEQSAKSIPQRIYSRPRHSSIASYDLRKTMSFTTCASQNRCCVMRQTTESDGQTVSSFPPLSWCSNNDESASKHGFCQQQLNSNTTSYYTLGGRGHEDLFVVQ